MSNIKYNFQGYNNNKKLKVNSYRCLQQRIYKLIYWTSAEPNGASFMTFSARKQKRKKIPKTFSGYFFFFAIQPDTHIVVNHIQMRFKK